MGTVDRLGTGRGVLAVEAVERRLGRVVSARPGLGPDWRIIRSLFRFGLPTGIQGIAMNIGGVLHARVHRLAAAERGGAGGVRRLVHAAVLADHVDVGRD